MTTPPTLSHRTIAATLLLWSATVSADVITDWNAKANEILLAGRVGPPPANRAMAMAHVAAFEAVNAITARYPASGRIALPPSPGAAVDAAVAAAMHGTLAKAFPAQQPALEAAYRAALAAVPEGAAKTAGVALGERAAADIVASCATDGAATPDSYRPFSTAGTYVPTPQTAVPHWGQRRPWGLSAGNQFRPGPPPALGSTLWARDYNEVKALGARAGSQRDATQTEIARFWEATLPTIYHPLARAIALQPGREVTQNARFMAAVGMAMDDALVAVFDAKYAYNFWRPVTAIRNGDQDGNDATERDPMWLPFIETPMHPEYPCAHCTVAASLGAVLQAEIGTGPVPRLSTTSPTAPGVTRSWATVGEFTQEVGNARIYDGVHYRNSTEVGSALGRKVGEQVVSRFLR